MEREQTLRLWLSDMLVNRDEPKFARLKVAP